MFTIAPVYVFATALGFRHRERRGKVPLETKMAIGKGTRREANATNGGDQSWGTDNHQIQEERYEGDDEYRDIFGGSTRGCSI